MRPLLEKCATGEDVETYLASDTVQKEIHSRYAKDIRDIQAGKFPPSAFEDCMDSVGYCLFMMYR